MITQRGLDRVQDFLWYKQQEKAAIAIQKVWRGYRVRAALSQDQDNLYYEQYIQSLSAMYYEILNANRTSGAKPTPSPKEIEFMRKLNHQETYKVCHDYLLMLAEMEEVFLIN